MEENLKWKAEKGYHPSAQTETPEEPAELPSEENPKWKVEKGFHPTKPEEKTWYDTIFGITEEQAKQVENMPTAAETVVKSGLSGLTAGLTENVEKLKPREGGIGAVGGKTLGALLPVSKAAKLLSGPAMKLAEKSPYLKNQIGALLTMFGVGAGEEVLTTLAKGDIPTATDVLTNGAKWAALEGAFMAADAVNLIGTAIYRNSVATKRGRVKVVDSLYDKLMKRGVDLSNPEAATEAAIEILTGPLSQAEKQAFKTKGEYRTVTEKAKEPGLPITIVKPVGRPPTAAGPIPAEAPAIKPQDLKTKKILETTESQLARNAINLATPITPEPKDFRNEAEQITKDQTNQDLEEYAPKITNSKEFGHNVQSFVNQNFDYHEKIYKGLYKTAEEKSGELMGNVEDFGKLAGNTVLKIRDLETQPSPFGSVAFAIEKAMKDAGYAIQPNEEGQLTSESFIHEGDILVSKLIELSRRLNKIAKYGTVRKDIRDVVKPVVQYLKKDIRKILAQEPEALAAYNAAETMFGDTAEKYANDHMIKLRDETHGEQISKMVESPTMLTDLRKVLTPNQMKQVERKVLDDLQKMPYEKAKERFNEIRGPLSDEAREIGSNIVARKNPYNPTVFNDQVKETILKDVANAFNTGTRPTQTMKLWQTPQGQNLVKQTFKGSPNWPEIKDYLQMQYFHDMIASVVNEKGILDLDKFNKLMKDPMVMENIRSIGGEEAYNFFKNLSKAVPKIERNIRILKQIPNKAQIDNHEKELANLAKRAKERKKATPPAVRIAKEALAQQEALKKETSLHKGRVAIEKGGAKQFKVQTKLNELYDLFKEYMGLNEKAFFTIFGLMKLGVPNTVVTLLVYRVMRYLLTKPRVRNAFKKLTESFRDPFALVIAADKLGEAIEEAQEEEKQERKKK